MKKTALFDAHKQLNAKMVPFAGYEMPVSYTGIKEEHLCVREKVGLFDVSHMGEFVVRGKDATALLEWICSNYIAGLDDMQAQYNCMPNDKGGIVDDLIVYKWADTEYNLVVNASNIEKDWNWIESQIKAKGFDVELEDLSEKLSLIAVQGPKADELVQDLTDVDCGKIAFYHFNGGTVGGVEDVIISNTGYTGSGGFELYVWNKDAPKLWSALMESGKKYGVQPCGLASRDTLRLEKGYCLYGNDIDDETSPIEAGLGWITKFKKEFVMSDYHKKIKEDGATKKLVGFEMIDKGIPRKDYEIVDAQGTKIGVVSSGTQSPSLGKAIGLGYVDSNYIKEHNEFYISLRGKHLKAERKKLPFV